MEESARRRHLRLHDEGAGSPDRTPAWWSLEDALEAVPEAGRPLLERLGRRLFLDDAEVAGGGAGVERAPPLEVAWDVIERLREAILRAAGNGASPGQVRILHGRLDREARALTLREVGRCFSDSRTLLRDVSHDLRSPLNSVLFLADTLMSEHSGQLNEVQRRQVGVLYTAAVTLVGLVNDLIDASRLGEGLEIAVARAAFTVDAVLSDLKSLLGPLAAHRGATLRFHVETVGPRTGDRQLLSRVLINLVTNAIQAAGDEGHVEVHVTGPREGWLRVEVRDDGEGEDPEELGRLLSEDADPYGAGRTRGWTHGLGLAISSRLVRAAGGTITVDSRAGVGTRFSVDLPFPLVD